MNSAKNRIEQQSISAIVIIDDSPLRSATSSEFKKLFDAYSRHLNELVHHEAKVRPAYWRWLGSVFGDRIEKVKKLHSILLQKVALLNRMRELCIFEGFSRTGAFEQATDELPVDDFDDADENAQDSDQDSSDSDSFFEDDGYTQSESSWDARKSRAENGNSSEAPEHQSRQSKIKSVYRKLAQTLHPDLAREETELSKEYWQETQDAYQQGDLERLQLIWTMVSLHTNSLSRELRLSELRSAVDKMKEKLRTIKSEKRRLSRTDPSWGFQKKNRTKLEIELRDEIEKDEQTITNALKDVEDDLKVFSKPSKPKYGRGRGRYKDPDDEFNLEF